MKGEGYDCKVDVWGTGVLVMEMCEGKPPYYDMPPMRVVYLISTQGIPPLAEPNKWNADLVEFLKRCLVKDVLKRPGTNDLLKHPFLNKNVAKKESLAQSLACKKND